MHWAVPCISNLAKRESEAAPKSWRLQMVARVRLDASHVSRSVTARREKVTRYIRVLNELSEVRTFRIYSLRLRVLEHTVRENLYGSCSLSIWWFGHWLGRWSAIGRSGAVLFLCRFLRWISKKNGSLKRCARRSFDEAVSSVPVNRQDQYWKVVVTSNVQYNGSSTNGANATNHAKTRTSHFWVVIRVSTRGRRSPFPSPQSSSKSCRPFLVYFRTCTKGDNRVRETMKQDIHS